MDPSHALNDVQREYYRQLFPSGGGAQSEDEFRPSSDPMVKVEEPSNYGPAAAADYKWPDAYAAWQRAPNGHGHGVVDTQGRVSRNGSVSAGDGRNVADETGTSNGGSPEEYRGDDEQSQRRGSVPSARLSTSSGSGQSYKRSSKRFRLSHSQTGLLMEEFSRHIHPDGEQCERLAQEIPGLSARQVQVWFQNRRAKLKRMTNGDRDRRMSPLVAATDSSWTERSSLEMPPPHSHLPGTEPTGVPPLVLDMAIAAAAAEYHSQAMHRDSSTSTSSDDSLNRQPTPLVHPQLPPGMANAAFINPLVQRLVAEDYSSASTSPIMPYSPVDGACGVPYGTAEYVLASKAMPIPSAHPWASGMSDAGLFDHAATCTPETLSLTPGFESAMLSIKHDNGLFDLSAASSSPHHDSGLDFGVHPDNSMLPPFTDPNDDPYPFQREPAYYTPAHEHQATQYLHSMY